MDIFHETIADNTHRVLQHDVCATLNIEYLIHERTSTSLKVYI